MTKPRRDYPTIQLRQELALWHDDDLISFSGLEFYQIKGHGEHLAQIEFSELVYLDESGNVVVQNHR